MDFDLETELLAMRKYGRARLSLLKDGTWYASIAMNTNAAGATFEVHSDINGFGMPSDALYQLKTRVLVAVETIRAGVGR